MTSLILRERLKKAFELTDGIISHLNENSLKGIEKGWVKSEVPP